MIVESSKDKKIRASSPMKDSTTASIIQLPIDAINAAARDGTASD